MIVLGSRWFSVVAILIIVFEPFIVSLWPVLEIQSILSAEISLARWSVSWAKICVVILGL